MRLGHFSAVLLIPIGHLLVIATPGCKKSGTSPSPQPSSPTPRPATGAQPPMAGRLPPPVAAQTPPPPVAGQTPPPMAGRPTPPPPIKDLSSIATKLEWKGVAVQDPQYSIWGCAPVLGDDGKIHVFAARWPERNVDPAWRKSSEIAHYVAAKPEGPFMFSDVALKGTGGNTWDKYAPHNPEIKKVGSQYVLVYIANADYRTPPHPRNQAIGMAVSTSPYGPWRKVGKDGLVLTANDPTKWNHNSPNGVANPTFVARNGIYYLYFKSAAKDRPGLRYGLATATNLEGPYTMRDAPVTPNKGTLEDGSAFVYGDHIYLLTTDNHGHNTGIVGGGTLWKSKDGITFSLSEAVLGYDRVPVYYSGYDPSKVVKIYGPDPKLERPKVLLLDGVPAYLYGPSGWNFFGGDRTVNHVLKINL